MKRDLTKSCYTVEHLQLKPLQSLFDGRQKACGKKEEIWFFALCEVRDQKRNSTARYGKCGKPFYFLPSFHVLFK